MPKYDVQVKNPTSNNPPSDSTLREAFTDQGKELDEKLSGLPYGNLESLRNRSYVMEEDGFIREAREYMIGDMVTAARDNRLFVLDSLDALRQIGLENIDGEINITVSDPIKDAPPKSPSIWTYIKSWFNNKEAKAEIQAYKEAKTFQESFHRLVEDPRYTINPNPKPRKLAPEEKPAAQTVENQQPKVKTEPLNPSKMNPEQFYNHLEAMEKQGKEIDPVDVSMKGNPEIFYKSMEEMIRGQIAGDIKAKADKLTNPAEKDAFLDGQKHLYTSLAAGLGNFITKAVDRDLLNQMYAEKSRGLLVSKATVLQINGMEDYLKSIQAQNEANKQMEQSQASAQVQQNAAQMQVQQAQPEPPKAGPVSGM